MSNTGENPRERSQLLILLHMPTRFPAKEFHHSAMAQVSCN